MAYNWDYRNRLVEVTIGSGRKKQQVQYRYDYMNRLTHRNNELFIHNGWQVMFTLDAKSNIQNRYLWGAHQDELLCENGNFVLCDHLGTVRNILDSKGKNIAMLKYNAFGKLISDNRDLPLFCYTGKMTDDITNLQWNINRWYDAKVGRWISEDPIEFDSKDMNIYRYAQNQPHHSLDYFGLWSWEIVNNRHIFTAEKNDTFESLVSFIASFGSITLSNKNIVCIRPYVLGISNEIKNEMKKSWAQKKPYVCGGKYDATSLINAIPAYAYQSGNYSIGSDNSAPVGNQGYIESAGSFYGSSNIATGTLAAATIRDLANKGDTPIQHLILVGHGDRNSGFIGGFNDNGLFAFSYLSQLPDAKYNPWDWMSDWNWAIDYSKALPYGCWFSSNTQIRLVGCKTSDMARNAAQKFVRIGGTVYGTTKYTYAGNSQMGWYRSTKSGSPILLKNTPAEYNLTRYWSNILGEN
jgi:RHS repeat-associated protein